jgi:hypothetical protein
MDMATLRTHPASAAAPEDEIDLVRRIVAGDGSAFEQLMRQYNRRLFRLARAEEVAQCLMIPEATVRSRHFRAKELLRESLAREADLAERDLYEFGGQQCNQVVANVWKRLGASVQPAGVITAPSRE